MKWRHPPGQTVKINFDGVFDERRSQSASGVVVGDMNGHVLLTKTGLHNGVASAFAAEAIACRRATQIALEINREDIIIKGDSLSIIKKCNSTDFDKSMVGTYIHDIHRMKVKSRKIRFEFTPRIANNLAHMLATESLRRREEIYLIDEVPSYSEKHTKDESVREPD
ncbi:reverse transcriptase [Gossypium australe]|uniref:Reverse transcriptase n=1 Tax=Gossypium australe TaxID=47621 RepID=A0A5B6VJC6_9ROSI|nr:reverse transcriptase [Gossypium australe]